MKKFLIIALVLLFVLPINLFAQGEKEDKPLYIFNSKGENAKSFEDMAKAYEKETGVKVRVFSIGSGQDHSEPLRNEMNSKDMPTIYSIQGLKELVGWLEGGFAVDFNTVENKKFREFADKIAPGLRLTVDGSTSYGVPYNVEGYGYIVDYKMLEELFGSKDVFEDIRLASYEEWENLVKAVDSWIKNPSAKVVRLNNKNYTLANKKGELTKSLTGVFAVMGSQKWTYGDHFVNAALNALFSTAGNAQKADAAYLKKSEPLFETYARALDLKTSYLAGANGPEKRGNDFVSSAKYGYDQTVQIFSDNKALFFKQGNWAYGNINNVNPEKAARLAFLPVKMPYRDSDILNKEQSVEKLNTSIPIFVPNYYAINALASDDQKEKAYDFLVWLNTSETGLHFIKDEFNFVPFNADPKKTKVPNSLGNSIIEYLAKNAALSAPYHGAPASWSGDVLGLKVMEDYLTKENWSESDIKAIANYAVSSWIDLL